MGKTINILIISGLACERNGISEQAGQAEGGSKMGRIVGKVYNLARLLNDFSAVLSGRPGRVISRGINKKIGKTVGPRLYLKRKRGRR